MAILQNIDIKVAEMPVPFEIDLMYNSEQSIVDQRALMQRHIDFEFSDLEQSTLWQCMNDKTCAHLHKNLSSIVRRKLTSAVPVELYRGVSKTTLNMLYGLEPGDEFTLDRVTSFSSDFAVARQFANSYCYGTKVIFSLRNCPFAYNYKEDMLRILEAAPDSEFMAGEWAHEDSAKYQREDKIGMVQDEEEWMLPIGTTFRIVKIDDVQYDPLNATYTVYHLELISI